MTATHAAIRVSPELRDRINALTKRENRRSSAEELAFLVEQREEQLWWEAVRESYRDTHMSDPAIYEQAVDENRTLTGYASQSLAEEPEWPAEMVIERSPAEQAQLERDRA